MVVRLLVSPGSMISAALKQGAAVCNLRALPKRPVGITDPDYNYLDVTL
jgi:hypothetical protein